MNANEPKTVPPPHLRGDLNLAILRPLFAYLEKELGREALTEMSERTGIPEDVLLRPQRWATLEDFEAALAFARERLGSDAKFLEACAYDVVSSYGPLALVFRAATPLTSYKILARTVQFASRISTYELTAARPRSVTLRYRSTKQESRLMCLSRQAQLPTMPLIWWGLAPARLAEKSCIAHGDACCEYELHWSEPLAWRWPLAGLALGAAVAVTARMLGVHHEIVAPLVGGLVGTVVAFRRMVAETRDFHTDTTVRVGTLVQEHQNAIEEIIKLHQRQEAFNALLGERIEARTATLEAMVNELRSKGQESEVVLQTATHDMRNPLQVALLNAQVLTDETDPEVAALGRIIFDSVMSVEAQMKRLLHIAQQDAKAFEIHNQPLDIARFTERVRRNMQALVIARDIRTSVFRTREAPDKIETDIMLFDRVIDNLISNAVKYTERGSIVAEVGGTPGHLTFKISDTGRGISPERLEKVFVGGQRDARPLLGESHGIGLSSAIRLLDEIGGRLEVMSKPGVGTTIWAHVPIEPPKRDKALRVVDVRDVLRRVVTIRSAANG